MATIQSPCFVAAAANSTATDLCHRRAVACLQLAALQDAQDNAQLEAEQELNKANDCESCKIQEHIATVTATTASKHQEVELLVKELQSLRHERAVQAELEAAAARRKTTTTPGTSRRRISVYGKKSAGGASCGAAPATAPTTVRRYCCGRCQVLLVPPVHAISKERHASHPLSGRL